MVNYIIGDLPDGGLGGTHLILSFLEPSTPAIPPAGDAAWVKYAVATYAEMSGADRAAWMSRMHADGTKVLASLGGAAASHEIYKKYDAAAFGTRAAQYVVDLGLDGLDVDLEGWGNDPSGAAFLKDLTLAARAHFDAAAGGPYVLIHAPEMPDFWHDSLYMTLMADRAAFDAIDFCNVQFYNQIPFPDSAHVFTEDVYTPAEKAPTCLKSIAAGIAAASGGKITSDEANAKLLLGFPYKDGSFPVGKDNLNQGGAPQIALVTYGVSTLGYPLSGVFEWTAGGVAPADLAPWNAKMTAALSAGAA